MAHAHYEDRHEDYILVTKDDLREVRAFGGFQQALFGVGTFLFSGAFWLLISLLAAQDKFQITPWMGVCAVSMIFGIALAVVGLVIFHLKQKRLDKYFPPTTTGKNPIP